MNDSFFKLILALVEKYIATRLRLDPLAIEQTISSETHSQWTTKSGEESADSIITATATKLTEKSVIVNFISGENVRAVQISSESLGVNVDGELAKITHGLIEKFTELVDAKLVEQGGFWKLSKFDPKIDDKPSHKNHSPPPSEIGTGLLKVAQKTRTRPLDMPDFEDEYELKGRGNLDTNTGVFNIGDRDLNPPGLLRDPPMKPYYDPLSGGLAGGVAGGGMYPTADHPMFGQRQGNTSRLGVPPGARYDDPYGEDNLEDMGMGLPGNLRGRGFGGSPSGGPSSGGPPFGGGFGGPSFGGF